MIKYTFAFIFCFALGFGFSQNEITTLEGYGKNCANCTVEVFAIDDFLSMKEARIANGLVKGDSTFELNFFNTKTQKVKVKVGKNYFSMYIEPNGKYDVFVSAKSAYTAYRPEGNEVQFFFGGDLSENDINYKVINFEADLLDFLKLNYRRTDAKTTDFVAKLDSFKLVTTEKYAADTSVYFKTYIRYGIASLDDLTFDGARNKYEKYDFYIKPYTVFYENDRYMEYILNYYDDYHMKLSAKTNNSFYEGVINASPSMIMQGLGTDYSLKNLRLREVVMIKMLGDIFYSPDYPQTNIMMILDSVANHALFEANKEIALNIKKRLIELVPGSKAPNYTISINGEKKTRTDYLKFYHYIQFVNEDFSTSISEVQLLNPLNTKYGERTKITTIIVSKNPDFKLDRFKKKNNITWDISVIDENNVILKQFGIGTYPEYVLIDRHGYIVAAPALGPKPNGDRKTIEETLFSINKIK